MKWLKKEIPEIPQSRLDAVFEPRSSPAHNTLPKPDCELCAGSGRAFGKICECVTGGVRDDETKRSGE